MAEQNPLRKEWFDKTIDIEAQAKTIDEVNWVDHEPNGLAQSAQEPVAHLCGPDENGLFGLPTADKACKDCFPVYTAPPQRPWVGLTKEAIAEFGTWYDNREEEVGWVSPSEIVAYIDDKLRSKNNAA